MVRDKSVVVSNAANLKILVPRIDLIDHIRNGNINTKHSKHLDQKLKKIENGKHLKSFIKKFQGKLFSN